MLSSDILLYIFGNFLSINDLIRLRLVSRGFNKLATDRVVQYTTVLRTLHYSEYDTIIMLSNQRYRELTTNYVMNTTMIKNDMMFITVPYGTISYKLKSYEIIKGGVVNCVFKPLRNVMKNSIYFILINDYKVTICEHFNGIQFIYNVV